MGIPFLRVRGRCPICEQETEFVAENEWLRDYFVCTGCLSIPRERALMVALDMFYPNWRDLRVHESSPANRGVSKKLSQECKGYMPSHYFPRIPLGSIYRGFRCENLEQLTFGDETFDLTITQDVMEHVFNPEKAFQEIMRTTKSGGAHVFTTPLVRKNQP